ncbi:MAG: hypothetical protein WDM71_10645 [Ferruginibacter sp.]
MARELIEETGYAFSSIEHVEKLQPTLAC